MKKILITTLFLLSFSAFAYEQIPVLIDNSAINIEYEKDSNNLINTSEMKNSSRIENAKKKSKDLEKRKIKLDTKQIRHQRALDYSTKQQNMLLPLF